jgi:hypothetical protein
MRSVCWYVSEHVRPKLSVQGFGRYFSEFPSVKAEVFAAANDVAMNVRKQLRIHTDGIRTTKSRHMIVCSWIWLATEGDRICGMVSACISDGFWHLTHVLADEQTIPFSDLIRLLDQTLKSDLNSCAYKISTRKCSKTFRQVVRTFGVKNIVPRADEPTRDGLITVRCNCRTTSRGRIVRYFHPGIQNCLIAQAFDVNGFDITHTLDPIELPCEVYTLSAYASVVVLHLAFGHPRDALTMNMQYAGTRAALSQLRPSLEFEELDHEGMVTLITQHLRCYVMDLDETSGAIDMAWLRDWSIANHNARVVFIGSEQSVSIFITHASIANFNWRWHIASFDDHDHPSWSVIIFDK